MTARKLLLVGFLLVALSGLVSLPPTVAQQTPKDTIKSIITSHLWHWRCQRD